MQKVIQWKTKIKGAEEEISLNGQKVFCRRWRAWNQLAAVCQECRMMEGRAQQMSLWVTHSRTFWLETWNISGLLLWTFTLSLPGCRVVRQRLNRLSGHKDKGHRSDGHHRQTGPPPPASMCLSSHKHWLIVNHRAVCCPPTFPQTPQCSVYHVKLWHVMFHFEGNRPTWPILPTDLHPAARRTLTSAGRRGSSSFTKPQSQITHFPSLRFLPFKAKPSAPDWVRLEKSALNTCRLWLGVSRAAPQAEKHMCPSNANQTPRTFQLPASAVWTCGAAWKTALEGLGRTQWGLLAVFRALTLVPSYLYDPSWPLAGLATTKAPKRGRRWMEGRSKRNWKTEKGGKKMKKNSPNLFLLLILLFPWWVSWLNILYHQKNEVSCFQSANTNLLHWVEMRDLMLRFFKTICGRKCSVFCFFFIPIESRVTHVLLFQITDILLVQRVTMGSWKSFLVSCMDFYYLQMEKLGK